VVDLSIVRAWLLRLVTSVVERGFLGSAVRTAKRAWCDDETFTKRVSCTGAKCTCCHRRRPNQRACWRAAEFAGTVDGHERVYAAGVRLTSMVARYVCVPQVLTPATPVAYSFSGCSWLLIYHFGAATALAEADLHHAKHGASFLGTSSGALAAAALACDVDMAVLKQFYFELLRDSHTRVLGPMGRMSR